MLNLEANRRLPRRPTGKAFRENFPGVVMTPGRVADWSGNAI